MSKRFVYMFFLKNEPERLREISPRHVEFWKKFSSSRFLGGVFSDFSGGLITFEAVNMAEARALIINDPFFSEGLIEQKWIKEWVHPEKMLSM